MYNTAMHDSGRYQDNITCSERNRFVPNFHGDIPINKNVKLVIIMRMPSDRLKIDVTVVKDFKVPAGHMLAGIKCRAKSVSHIVILTGNRKICNVRNNYHNRVFLP